jgi:DnaJ-class molecular chaperone
MKLIKRIYKRICHNCKGSGTDYHSRHTNAVCVICGGSGVETVTEVEEISDFNDPTNYTNRTDTAGNPIKEITNGETTI